MTFDGQSGAMWDRTEPRAGGRTGSGSEWAGDESSPGFAEESSVQAKVGRNRATTRPTTSPPATTA